MREFEQMKCSSSLSEHKKSGTTTGRRPEKLARFTWNGRRNYRFHDRIGLAHYADAACDIEFNFPMGFKELKEFTHELILTLSLTKSTAEESFASSIQKQKRAIFHT